MTLRSSLGIEIPDFSSNDKVFVEWKEQKSSGFNFKKVHFVKS